MLGFYLNHMLRGLARGINSHRHVGIDERFEMTIGSNAKNALPGPLGNPTCSECSPRIGMNGMSISELTSMIANEEA